MFDEAELSQVSSTHANRYPGSIYPESRPPQPDRRISRPHSPAVLEPKKNLIAVCGPRLSELRLIMLMLPSQDGLWPVHAVWTPVSDAMTGEIFYGFSAKTMGYVTGDQTDRIAGECSRLNKKCTERNILRIICRKWLRQRS
jgi:hypothetical protein